MYIHIWAHIFCGNASFRRLLSSNCRDEQVMNWGNVESFGRQTAVPLGNELSTHSFRSPFCSASHHNAKRCQLHQRRKKQRSNNSSSLPLAYPEYLQLGMSGSVWIHLSPLPDELTFQVASSVLHEPIHEGLWKHQRSVSYLSMPAQRAAANHEFCSVYLSLRDQPVVLELVIWYKECSLCTWRVSWVLANQETEYVVTTLVVYDRDPPP